MTSQSSGASRPADQREFQEFTSYLGHEVRGPLTVILGNAVLLQRLSSSDEVLRDGLQDIREQAEKLSRITEGLFSLVGAHSESEPLSTGIVVSRVVELFHRQHPSRPLHLAVETDSMAMGVQSYVEEILENLLSNADKYSPAGESIDVEVHGSRSQITIAVEDNGRGIDRADQKRIFGLFVRLDQTAAIPGHGIGLALSQRLAEAMDGELRYENGQTGGSRFLLTIPAQEASALFHTDREPFGRKNVTPCRRGEQSLSDSPAAEKGSLSPEPRAGHWQLPGPAPKEVSEESY